nr:hypothetical protein [Tanacetum cinerariifolium]
NAPYYNAYLEMVIKHDQKVTAEKGGKKKPGTTPANDEASTGPSTQPQDDASANIVRESLSFTNAKTGADTDKINSGGDTKILHIDEEQGKDVDNQVKLEEKTAKVDQGQAGSNPGKTPKS